jgi:DNA polymerase III subunit delta'
MLEEPYLTPLQWYEKIGVENKQGAISIHESKSILKKLSLKPFESDYKVMILWLPEKMNSQAANKLLKLLEEPPEKTLFLLVSQDTSTILPTILSRTQLIKVPGISRKELADYISGTFGIPPGSQMDGILDYAAGSYLRVKEYFDTEVDDEFYFKFFVQFMRICYRLDISALLDWVDELAQQDVKSKKSSCPTIANDQRQLHDEPGPGSHFFTEKQ